MLVITKTLNSSVVLVEQNGQQMILLGKGIGYGKKAGMLIKHDEVSQVFMPVDNLYVKQMLASIDSIQAEYFELAQDIVVYAEHVLGNKLNNNIYFALADHLHFAVERFENGMNISNHVFWEIKTFYASEYQIGEFSLHQLNKRLGLELPVEEAANIAFHIINAQSDKSEDVDAARAALLVAKIVNIAKFTVGEKMNQDDIHYPRFITHVKFFVKRFFSGKMLKDEDDPLFEHLQIKYPKAMGCALRIKSYIQEKFNQTISKEETTYLAVHIYRLLNI